MIYTKVTIACGNEANSAGFSTGKRHELTLLRTQVEGFLANIRMGSKITSHTHWQKHFLNLITLLCACSVHFFYVRAYKKNFSKYMVLCEKCLSIDLKIRVLWESWSLEQIISFDRQRIYC